MRFKDAIRLQPGTRITFQDDKTERDGVVIHVTPRGGIKVRINLHPTLAYYRKNNLVARWVHYSKVAA